MTSTIDRNRHHVVGNLEGDAERDADVVQVVGPDDHGPRPFTNVPVRNRFAVAPQRRQISAWSRDDFLLLGGVALSSVCTTMLLFGRLTSLSGKLGFTVVGFVVFIVTYAVMSALTEERPAVVDRVMTVMMAAAALVAGFALTSVVFYTFYRGWPALMNGWLPRLNFYTQDLRVAGPEQALDTGGVLHAIVGTLIMTVLSLVFTVPLAMTCAVFLTESRSRAVNPVRTIVTAMTALPSIVAGLFIFATWVLVIGFPRSGLAASIAISIMMLPIIIRSADVVLRLVPGNLREASAALGAPQWRTVWHVVLPTARSGLTTSVILGVARGVGETAPVLLTSGYATTLNLDATKNPMASLPVTAFKLVSSPDPEQIARGFGAASVLMVIVLVLFSVARLLGGRPVGRLSPRQARRRDAQSSADLERIERILAERGSGPGGISADPAAVVGAHHGGIPR
jgi:phosphate transport system permease protein